MELTVNPIEQYVQCVFEPNDWVEIRTLRKRGDGKTESRKLWYQANTLADAQATLGAPNQQGWNVYVGANPRIAEGKSGDENVQVCRCLFADFDGLDPDRMEDIVLERINAAGLPWPTLLVHSGHGIHAYWRLTAPTDPKTFRALQARLAHTLDSDGKVINAERVMRLPGFDNVKSDPVPCRIIAADPDHRVDLTDFAAKLKTLPKPETQPVPREARKTNYLEARGRAALYLAKCPGVSQGERNDAAFKHAKKLQNDFDLDAGEAWNILADWNGSNNPPLPEAELRQAFESAQRSPSVKPRGCKLHEDRRSARAHQNSKSTDSPSASLGNLLAATIDGRRTAVEWVHRELSRLTEALLPGSVVTLCGPKGVCKTFFCLGNLIFWVLTLGLRCAMLLLEEDVNHALLRCLAQLGDTPQITKSKWIRANAEEARRIHAAHAQDIDRLGRAIWDSPDAEMSLPDILTWVDTRAQEGCRIVVVDPITAAKQGDSQWKADTSFVNELKRLARRRGISVVLATHPTKGSSTVISLDSLAGSTAWVRFTQTVLWLEKHDPKDVTVLKECGRAMVSSNRTLHILAARNGNGDGKRLALNFYQRTADTPPQLKFDCEGLILRKNETSET